MKKPITLRIEDYPHDEFLTVVSVDYEHGKRFADSIRVYFRKADVTGQYTNQELIRFEEYAFRSLDRERDDERAEFWEYLGKVTSE